MNRKVGFIGLGNMGKGMCKNLIQAGNDVVVYDTNREAMLRFEGKAYLADDVMDVYRRSEFIFFSLPNSDIVSGIVDQYIEAGMEGRMIIDTSTCYPFTTQTLAARIKAAGGAMIDTPLLAGPAEAEDGTLILVVGGEAEDVSRADELLKEISKSYKHIGPSGTGHFMKLAVNFCSLTEALMFAQLYPVMKRCGIAPETVYDCLNNEIFDNWVFQFYSDKYVKEDYRMDFAMRLGFKDLSYMKKIYDDLKIPGFILDGDLALCRATLEEEKKEGTVVDFSYAGRIMSQLLGLV